MKKKVAIVLGATKNYFFAIGCVVLGIKRFSPNFADDILVFYDTVHDKDKRILEELGCRLIPYTPPAQRQYKGACFQRFTYLSLSIYEIFRLLKSYKSVLWLDGDVCIQNDISGIIDFGPIGIRYGGSSFSSALGQSISPDIDNESTYNTGVVYVDDSLINYERIYEECYRYTLKFLKTVRLPDQGVINYVLWKNDIKITKLPMHYNYTAALELDNYGKATIFHIAHEYKFWNHSVMYNLFPLWKSYYKQWTELGGSVYMGPQLFPEIGECLSMQQLLELLTNSINFNNFTTTPLQDLVNEQQNTIDKLEKDIESLLKLINNIKIQKKI